MQMGQASWTGGETGKRSATNWGPEPEEQWACRAVTSDRNCMQGWQARFGSETKVQSACLVMGDSIIQNVKSERLSVQCFPGIRTGQLKRVVINRDLRIPDIVVIYVGTNNVRRVNLANTSKTKFPQSRLILNGVIRLRDLSWRYIGALNTFGVTFVYLNSCIAYSKNWLSVRRILDPDYPLTSDGFPVTVKFCLLEYSIVYSCESQLYFRAASPSWGPKSKPAKKPT
jgi:hypothetical protein